MPYIGKTTDGFGVRNRFVYLASSGATSVSGADANGATLTFTDGAYVDVYLNGVLLKPTTDYNTSTANTIAGLSALNTNDEVTVVVYDVFTVADMVSATSGGTFSGNVTFDGTVTNSSTTTLNDDVTFTGANYNILWDKSNDLLQFGDSAKLHFGAGDDLQIYHDGSNTYIDEAGTGSLFIRSSRVSMHKYTGETMINAAADGAVSLYYDDVKKLETTSSSVEIYQANLEINRSSESSTDAVLYFNGNGVDWSIGTDASESGYLKISNNATPGTSTAMTFGPGGRIGIGDSSQTNTTLTVTDNSDTDKTGLKVTCGATNHDGITIWSVQGDTSSTIASTVLYGGYSNSAHRYFVRGDGDIETAGSTTVSSISDINYKENIVDANSQWDDIKAMRFVNYSYKEDKLDKPDKLGLIAQELEKVSPNLVFNRNKRNDIQYIKDENKTLKDEDGNDIKDADGNAIDNPNYGKDIDNPDFGKVIKGETYKTVKMNIVTLKATKALQEAMARIETLEAKVKTLEEA